MHSVITSVRTGHRHGGRNGFLADTVFTEAGAVAGLMNANQNNQTISALPPVMIHLQAARSYLYQAITPGAPKYPDIKTKKKTSSSIPLGIIFGG